MSYPHPLRRRSAIAIALAVVATMSLTALPAQASPNDDSTASSPGQDTASALVQLTGEPLATYAKTKPAQGKKIDFTSTAVKSYRAQLNGLRNDYKAWLRKNVPGA